MSSKYFITPLPSKYKARSCPIFGLDPQQIKKCIDQYSTSTYNFLDKESGFSRQTYLNAVAKTLGFSDWTKYVVAYEKELVPFMQEKGLKYYASDDYSILKSHNMYKINHFTLRQISDRLFLSNRPLPKAIFTGYDCDIDFSHFYPWARLDFSEKPNEYLEALKPFVESQQYQDLLVKKNLDFIIPLFDITPVQNLLGDVFVKNEPSTLDQYVYQEYWTYQGLVEQTQYHGMQHYFHQMLLKLNKGWLEVIPYSQHLIFLKSSDGYYDFVFKNLRESPYYSPYQGYIKFENIPTILKEPYDFERWQYFGFKGDESQAQNNNLWKERDSHEAEIAFYTNNTLSNYPSEHEILKHLYISKKQYVTAPLRKATIQLDGFQKIQVNDKALCISPLVSIKEFLEFNQEYSQTRSKGLDELTTVNIETDDSLPISATWYDAIAYCKWLEDKYSIDGIRLLSPEEYIQICPKKEHDNNDETYYFNYGPEVLKELIFMLQNQNIEFNPWDNYIKDFECNVIMKWRKKPNIIQYQGLEFCINATFKEWTLEEGVTLFAPSPYNTLSRGTKKLNYYGPHLNNKYKYIKTGFRVCYELAGGAR